MESTVDRFLLGSTHKPVALDGLTQAEVLQRRKRYGQNILPAEKRTSAWTIFFAQFKSPLVYIILAVAAVSLVAGEYGDFAIIMVVVLIDAVPSIRNLLGIVPLNPEQWALIGGVAVSLLGVVEIGKWISHHAHRGADGAGLAARGN